MSESFGKPLRRHDDARLLRGEGRYASDLTFPGMLTAAVYRSPVAHASIREVDTRAALQLTGVVAVFVANDLGAAQLPLPSFGQFPKALIDEWHPVIRDAPHPTLADTKVRYVGQPIALVVAESRALAEDALDLIDVDFDVLPALTSVDDAQAPGAPRLFDAHPDNVALALNVKLGDADAAFTGAAHVVGDRFSIQRYSGMPLEGRSVCALPEPGGGLTVWTTQQLPHFHRALVCKALGLPEFSVRMLQPDIGGGFGQKAGLYPEDVLIPFAAHRLGRPVKWLEDKREQLLSSSHSREQRFDAEMAFDREGRILGLRYRASIDAGAYLTFPVVLPYIGLCHFLGPYRVPALRAEIRSVLTNKTTSAPYRGAGRPETVFVLNRLIDRGALAMNVDPVELRRRNMIRADEMPYKPGLLYRDGTPMQLDSGDYPKALDAVLAKIGYDEFRKEQQTSRAAGRYVGIGIACNVESGGIGPFESARVRIEPSGKVAIHLGVTDSGQGHKTVFAQVCADLIGVAPHDIVVTTGDTGSLAYSRGTYHSRGAVAAGNAVHMAAGKVRAKVLEIASRHFEVGIHDLELADGHVRVAGADLKLSLGQCAALAAPESALPAGRVPGLDETSYFQIDTTAWGNAAHAAIVEVDPKTGGLTILRYAVLHDCGRMINPLLVRGQVQGGIAAGIGGALMEELVYDPDGNLLTTNLADYLMPRFGDFPEIEILHMESPSPLNPLGVKGAGEGGTVSPPAALAAAVEDALSPFGARIASTPLSPHAILAALRVARTAGAADAAGRL